MVLSRAMSPEKIPPLTIESISKSLLYKKEAEVSKHRPRSQKNQLDDGYPTTSKTGVSAENVKASSTNDAIDCTSGFLIVNGCKLHSHICFHLNSGYPYEENDEWEKTLMESYTEELKLVFDDLDSKIRSGYFEDESTIKVDALFSGGVAGCEESESIFEDAKGQLLERIEHTERLANNNGITIDFNQSLLWGQDFSKDYSPETSLVYDPKSNTIYISTRASETNTNLDIEDSYFTIMDISKDHKLRLSA